MEHIEWHNKWNIFMISVFLLYLLLLFVPKIESENHNIIMRMIGDNFYVDEKLPEKPVICKRIVFFSNVPHEEHTSHSEFTTKHRTDSY